MVAIGGVRYHEDADVTDGKIAKSRGWGTSIDFALALVEQLAGRGEPLEVNSSLVMMR